jgi:hypothetical protein
VRPVSTRGWNAVVLLLLLLLNLMRMRLGVHSSQR